MNKRFSELANSISEVGISSAFGIPGGGTSLELIDCLYEANIPFFRTHHEGAAAIMAGTIGRLSGKPGLALSIKGPGLTNMVPGISLCYLENFPLLAICESYDQHPTNTNVHKRMDHDNLVKKISKGSFYYNNSIQSFKEAFNLSESENPGPVLLNLANGKEARFVKEYFPKNHSKELLLKL